jgi:protein-S-isoprenylcysteine O-methyltransferase Ste14
MQIFIKWAQKTPSVWKRLTILGIGAIIFPVLIPTFLIVVITKIDQALGVKSLLFGPIGLVIGAILIGMGGMIALWTISVQFTRASGTPFPMMPTKKLITDGPFALCRNPMSLGTIMAYAGLSLAIGSISSLITVALFTALLLGFIKQIEEKELALRFGDEYVRYKAATPFLIPGVLRRARK